MKYVKQLMIIFSISFIAEVLEYLIPLPIAASVYGLVLMLAALITKIIRLEQVERATDFLIEIMPIMFVPPTVSIMTNFAVLQEILIPLTLICVVTTVVVMAVTGHAAQFLMRISGREQGVSSKNVPENVPKTVPENQQEDKF